MDELYHHGVKGQKWGVRRYLDRKGNLTSAGKKRYGSKKNLIASQKEKESRKRDLKNVRTMSDQELRKKIDRLKLENEYKKLADADIHKGKNYASKAANDFLGTPAKKIATAAIAGGAAYVLSKAIKNKGNMKGVMADIAQNPQEFANWLIPNPNKKK